MIWQTADGAKKLELIKLDRDQRPFIEGKGAAAKKYEGPQQDELDGLRKAAAPE